MNIVIEEIVLNPLIQIEETITEVTLEISEMQVPGQDGKSAYQSALEGGFVGTELEFNDFLSQIGDVVNHITQTDNPHEVTKSQVGLPNVDNTSDADKPVSTATNTALGLKVDKVSGERLINATEITKLSNQSGTNTGDETAQTIINKIGDGSKINQSYLPSYVDDILEYDTISLFPLVGELGKIYIVTTGSDINKQYRWTGSLYTQITNGLIASTNDVPEGINNLYFTVARFLANLTATNIKNALGITTLSGSNTGDQDLSVYVKNIAINATQGANITGTVSETILYSKLIPANTFKDGDFMNIVLSRIGKVGVAGTLNQRIRINTSNTLAASLVIATNFGVNTILMANMSRIFNITNGNLISVRNNADFSTDIIDSTLEPQTTVFNPVIDNYIFVTGTLSNSADTMYHLGTKITN